jgi:hypothetical protein
VWLGRQSSRAGGSEVVQRCNDLLGDSGAGGVSGVGDARSSAAGWIWASASATHCESERDQYRRRRDQGGRHAAANRHLFNELIGQLYLCLQHQQRFDEAKALPLTLTAAA